MYLGAVSSGSSPFRLRRYPSTALHRSPPRMQPQRQRLSTSRHLLAPAPAQVRGLRPCCRSRAGLRHWCPSTAPHRPPPHRCSRHQRQSPSRRSIAPAPAQVQGLRRCCRSQAGPSTSRRQPSPRRCPLPPAAIAVTPLDSPSTCTSTRLFSAQLFPSWLRLLLPQHFAAPSTTAQVSGNGKGTRVHAFAAAGEASHGASPAGTSKN